MNYIYSGYCNLVMFEIGHFPLLKHILTQVVDFATLEKPVA